MGDCGATTVNDELDETGVRDAAHMVRTGIIDVGCANHGMFYYDQWLKVKGWLVQGDTTS